MKRLPANSNLFISTLFPGAAIIIFSGLIAFTKPEKQLISSPKQTINWVLSQSTNGVDLYHAILSCGNSRKVLLRFNNKNKKSVTLRWKESFKTSQIPEDVEGAGGEKTIHLKPGETKALGCSSTDHPNCLIDPQQAIPTYRADITSFSFREVSATPD